MVQSQDHDAICIPILMSDNRNLPMRNRTATLRVRRASMCDRPPPSPDCMRFRRCHAVPLFRRKAASPGGAGNPAGDAERSVRSQERAKSSWSSARPTSPGGAATASRASATKTRSTNWIKVLRQSGVPMHEPRPASASTSQPPYLSPRLLQWFGLQSIDAQTAAFMRGKAWQPRRLGGRTWTPATNPLFLIPGGTVELTQTGELSGPSSYRPHIPVRPGQPRKRWLPR
jgi:hypothetical protein